MEDLPRLVLGVLGTLAIATCLVLGSASALQAWHNVRQSRPGPTPVDAATAEPVTPPSTYWSGRL